MFKKVSRSGVGAYGTVITGILIGLGADVDEGMVTEALLAIANGVSALMMFYGIIVRKDLKFGVIRK